MARLFPMKQLCRHLRRSLELLRSSMWRSMQREMASMWSAKITMSDSDICWYLKDSGIVIGMRVRSTTTSFWRRRRNEWRWSSRKKVKSTSLSSKSAWRGKECDRTDSESRLRRIDRKRYGSRTLSCRSSRKRWWGRDRIERHSALWVSISCLLGPRTSRVLE